MGARRTVESYLEELKEIKDPVRRALKAMRFQAEMRVDALPHLEESYGKCDGQALGYYDAARLLALSDSWEDFESAFKEKAEEYEWALLQDDEVDDDDEEDV